MTTEAVAVVLLACAVVIAGVFVVYRRGWLGGTPKVEDQTPAGVGKQ